MIMQLIWAKNSWQTTYSTYPAHPSERHFMSHISPTPKLEPTRQTKVCSKKVLLRQKKRYFRGAYVILKLPDKTVGGGTDCMPWHLATAFDLAKIFDRLIYIPKEKNPELTSPVNELA
ncbi:hypothetical protein TNCV_4704831 [Trichonephila clavipes]|nr:hypothetical protein TNCV_4704831 [Trichonephila clavipes]